MSASTSVIGFGGDLLRSTDGNSYTTVGQIVSITPPEGDTTRIDHTNLASPNTAKEKRPGLLDLGEPSFTMLWARTAYNTLFGDWKNRTTPLYWRITWDDAATDSKLEFQGWVGHIKAGEMQIDDKVVSEVTIVTTTLPAFTAGS